jgi:hypothetical protein
VRARLLTLPFLARALLGVVAVLAVAGCEVRTEIGIQVHEDGSGTVAVDIGLDDEAARRSQFRTDDLAAAGWTVSEPTERDGLRWQRAEKSFATVEQAAAVLAELSGAEGPFRDFRLTRQRPFARTRFTFEGTVDFSKGLEAFTDPELAELLDGEPLGEDPAALEEQLGQSLDRVFTFRVALRLPGDVSSNAPGQAGNGAVWEPRLSEDEPVELRASSQVWRWGPLLWTAVSAAAALGALVLVATMARAAVRRRRAPGRHDRIEP